MQDAFREVLRDIIYRRWILARYYWYSLKLQASLYGDSLPVELQKELVEVEDLMDYLEADKLFSPNRNLPVRACTLRACT
jgi:hypothetical protein